MDGWDFLVDKANLSRTRIDAATVPGADELADGSVVLEVERFALTANNVTYGAVGERLGYWSFFPAPDGWGRIPAWGFARVLRSRADDVAEGTRLYGYLPMSTHVAMRLRRSAGGFVDAADHRAVLPPVYNAYVEAPETPVDDQVALLHPLFTTSFLLDDMLAGSDGSGPATAILTSASSKTALGLAFLLASRGARVVALTSARNEAFVRGIGWYGGVATYDALGGLEVDGPVALIDFAGDQEVVTAVHRRFGERMVHSAIVGGTHWEARSAGRPDALPGPAPMFFFAPDLMRSRSREWGAEVFRDRVAKAMTDFVAACPWLLIESHAGPTGLEQAYASVLRGDARPDRGHVVRPL